MATGNNQLAIDPKHTSDNPFCLALRETENNPVKLQRLYNQNRLARNARNRATILDPKFPGWSLDRILMRLEGSERDPNYTDPRNNLLIWARPPTPIQELIQNVQDELRKVAPNLWYTPRKNLHMSALEIDHSLSKPELEAAFAPLKQQVWQIVNYTYTNRDRRARLVKPLVTYDTTGLALSFVPAAGEGLGCPRRRPEDDQYTYHHLRCDLYQMTVETGTRIKSRYIAPSAHVTIARFLTNEGFISPDASKVGQNQLNAEKLKEFINKIGEVNTWLQNENWPEEGDKQVKKASEWVIGEEKGLDFQKGPIWYGHNHSVAVGYGF